MNKNISIVKDETKRKGYWVYVYNKPGADDDMSDNTHFAKRSDALAFAQWIHNRYKRRLNNTHLVATAEEQKEFYTELARFKDEIASR